MLFPTCSYGWGWRGGGWREEGGDEGICGKEVRKEMSVQEKGMRRQCSCCLH